VSKNSLFTTKLLVRQSRNQIRKKVFTKRDTKSTKFGVLIIRTLGVLRMTILGSMRGLRKFSAGCYRLPLHRERNHRGLPLQVRFLFAYLALLSKN